MTLRSTLRWLIWATAWSLVLLATRPAHAAAPICDERGASAIAPTPVLPARDVKIDTGFPMGCDAPAFAVTRLRPHARTGATAVVDGSFDEVWMHPAPQRFLKLAPGQELTGSVVSLPPSSGYRRGVFRPPRD